ncbi:hypothetical protein AB6806_19480 [Bosea sp. RCC_152_1]|uniref:hypothetical protein n=1 Tax=Bosea sp. RCC_152_1 TaxID=3239228 RepID=UPI0035249CC8
MSELVSIGMVCGKPCVAVREHGEWLPMVWVASWADAQRLASDECVRLGLPRCYCGVRASS